MQHINFGKSSDMASFAGYDPEKEVLYLTFRGGPTTIAYENIKASLFEELTASPYPDACIRFKIQAKHPFRRIEPTYERLDMPFMK